MADRRLERLGARDVAAAQAYWREALRGFAAPTPLPEDGAAREGGRAGVTYELGSESLNALEALARSERVTWSTIVHTAWALLLSRYSGEDDVLFGATVPADALPAGVVPVRTRIDPSAPVRDCLEALQADAVVRSASEHVPLGLILSWSDVPPGMPLFESVVAFEDDPLDAAAYPLVVTVASSGAAMSLAIAYDRSRFRAVTVERLVAHLSNLLEAIAASPDAPAGEIDMLGEIERRRLVAELTGTAVSYPRDRAAHELFEAQATTAPDAVALAYGDAELTYGELDGAANRLAHHLRDLGVTRETVVGVCLERSVEFVVSLLAVLKAGGAYVPLDPDYPHERLAFMLEDSGAAVVVTDSKTRDRLGNLDAAVVLLDQHRDAISARAGTDPGVVTTPDDLAYVIYTSGSTGRPKGVAVRHAGLTNLVTWHDDAYAVTARDRASLVAPLGFDASVWELWPYLACGAAVALPPDEVRHSPPDLCAWLERRGVTIAFVPTALVHEILGSGLDLPVSLRTVVTGGDLLRMRPRADAGFELVNHYGPTETTVAASAFRVGAGDDGPVPIGRPIANTHVYVLDPCGNLVPRGVAGELYIGGEGLARGYLNRPALTAERFVPDPFSGVPGARLYRSGDRARLAADGTLEFLGRVDHQVKIRGFRIEPGEIEAALSGHPAVKDAVVVARSDEGSDARLVAYLVAHEDAPTTTELRRHLAKSLPDYMVPGAFVTLDEVPLTPHGKLDRQALPAPEGRPDLDAAYVAPRTPTEELLAGIWSQVLGVERVGVHDDFFDLGGHSLTGTQIVSRLRATLGVEVSVVELFAKPTIALLAVEVEAQGGRDETDEGPRLTRREGENTAPLSFQQEQMWFYNKLAPGSLAYQTQSTISVEGPLDVDVFERAVTEIARRHETLRTTYREVDGHPRQVVHPPGPVTVTRVDLSSLPADERAAALDDFVRKELRTPFDISKLPLIRWSVVCLAPDRYEIVLVEHHLVHDGWSYTVLTRELTALYNAFARGEDSPLEEPPVQYQDYARWQREAIDSPGMRKKRAEWLEQLAGVTRAAELPTDYERPEVKSSVGNTIRIELPPEIPDALAAFCQEARVTPFMAMTAAFVLALHRHSGETDVTIASGFANRTFEEIDGLIGMFVNPVLLRCSIAGNPSVRAFVHHVRDVVLNAVRNQDFPFSEVVRALNPPRTASRSPLLEVMFALHDAALPEIDFAGAPGKVTERSNGSAKTDLNIIVIPGAASRVVDGNRIAMLWEYDTSLFEQATIERLIDRFTNLLGAIAATPDAPVSELDILEDAERHHLVAELNDTAVDYPKDRLVHELIEAQAKATPDAVALVAEDQELTYDELNRRANRLAHHLRAL
ncbi:MAG TPA: amino acid adenylation domain-containing protein, partial [Actinomycetota bacterium]|nr:amino acid adenylation domain-containing protein [Actinomycetota bacterium]